MQIWRLLKLSKVGKPKRLGNYKDEGQAEREAISEQA